MLKKIIRTILPVICFLTVTTASADVRFRMTSSGDMTKETAAKVEKNIAALLTEIDNAGKQGRELNFTGINIQPNAAKRLGQWWKRFHFVCDRSSYATKCLADLQGYQIRGIDITLKPQTAGYKQQLDRQLNISFDRSGTITGVRQALENQEDVQKMLNASNAVTDMALRSEILKFVEDLRCYYNERDTASLNKIYSEDALIITGSVITTKSSDGSKFTRDTRYKVQSKQEYIEKLKRILPNAPHVKIEFDRVSVVRHGAKPHIFGVTLHQKWDTGYKDEGWLFLLWDFSNPNAPQINLRSWQEESVAARDGVLGLPDIFIP